MKRSRLRTYWRYYARRLFPKTGSPAAVALSVFLGVFIGVLPTLGVALLLTLLITSLLRLPKGPALVGSFIATPPTLLLFFYPLGYFIGLQILQPPSIALEFLPTLSQLTLMNAGSQLALLWADAGWHLVAFGLGMTVVASVTATLCALMTLVVMERRKHRRKMARARLLRGSCLVTRDDKLLEQAPGHEVQR